MSSYGITGYRAYVPRLRRQCESTVLTHRAHRDRDEDSLAMAVEAALGVLCDLERAKIGR